MTNPPQDPALDCDQRLSALRQEFNLFVWTTAHELRNPVQTVLGLSELLEVDEPPERIAVTLLRIRQDAARLAEVVEDLYLRAECAAGNMRTNCRPFGLEDLLVEVAHTMERLYPAQLLLEYGNLPTVAADADHVRKILLNLLLNAMRYSRVEEERLIRLVATVDHTRRRVEIRVHDLAPHIPNEHREAVFEPRAELPREIGHPRFGLGLGLFVGRVIARKMSGDLWLDPADFGTVGNVFALGLPCVELT